MQIGIDYRFALSSVRGIGYYIKSVVHELMHLDTDHLYILYVDQEVQIDLPTNFKFTVINCKNILLFEQWYLPRRAALDQVDLIWYPSNSGPIFLSRNVKLLVTVHDTVSLKSSISARDFLSWKLLKAKLGEKYRGTALTLGRERINHIITVSQYTAKDLKRQFYCQVTVIPNRIELLNRSDDQNEVLDRFGVTTKCYFYTLTGPGTHKNLQTYIHLFKTKQRNIPLLISGIHDSGLIERYSDDHVIFTGYLTDEEKATLYANAKAFLFLSLQEGFGLPVLEAMQFHIPLILANRGALPEVAGEAGILVDPLDLTAINEALDGLENYEANSMALKQDIQIKKFLNWEVSAKEHLELFKRITS